MLSLDEIEDFLAYLANVRKYSPKTIETYKITLLEAVESVESFEENGKNIYDARGYRKKNFQPKLKNDSQKNIYAPLFLRL